MISILPAVTPVLDTSSLVVQHDPHQQLLLAKWFGNHDAQSARAGCGKLLELVHATGSTRLLNDSSEAFGEWHELTEWIGRDFSAQLQQAGIRAVAWVTAMDWPARSCVASSMQCVQQPLVTLFEFDQVEQAMAWLHAAGR